MRILFTGASSFTGAWFARALVDDECEIVATLRGPDAKGGSLRARRLALIRERCEIIQRAPFGGPAFLAAIRSHGPFDLVCHHGAEVGDHRRPDYDVDLAVAINTRGLEAVLDAMAATGCGALLLTGTVFEADEGEGEPPLRAFSPYGLAKTLTWHRFRFAFERRGLTLGKMVVPSPFGPLEKEGFTTELMRTWLGEETALVRRPRLVRDHVPVQFLARAYGRFAKLLPERRGTLRASPSGFALPLASFARRLATAMRPRLARGCRFVSADPPEPTAEPLIRRNLELVPELNDATALGAMWDAYAAYWQEETQRG